MLNTKARLYLIAIQIVCGFFPMPVDASPTPPNVIVILADDLGYGDTSLYPQGWVKTPQLDRMAEEGLLFTDFHANSSVCSPTRAAFLTGRYQQRVGIVDVITAHLDTPGLEPSQMTIPRLMKEAGYTTAIYGKWHLGVEPSQNPIHHGFDEFVGFLRGMTDFHDHRDWFRGTERTPIDGYSTHLITDHSIDFIKRNKDRPFFLYVSHQAVHIPFQTPEDPPHIKLTWDAEKNRPKYKVMLEEMDKGIGQILDVLEDCDLAENTFVFFFSDNGAIGAGGSNAPLRGGKFSHYEGGHRVPAVAWWPGTIEPGTTDATVMGTDLLPTIMEIASIKVPEECELDGTSAASLMLDGDRFPDRKLFFGYEPKLGTAMRDGDWKMIVKDAPKAKYELYNLKNDIGEQNNLAERYPDRAAEMAKEIEQWSKEVTAEGNAYKASLR